MILDNFFKKQFWLMAILAAFLPLLLMWIFLIAPTQAKMSGFKEDLNQAKILLDNTEQSSQTASQSAGLINQIEVSNLQKLHEFLPSTSDKEGLLQILEDKAKESGFVLKTVEINEAVKEALPARVKAMRIAANFVGGDYKAFKNLLSALEKNARLFDISSLSFGGGGGSYSLNFKTYWLENAAGAALKIDQKVFEDPVFQKLIPARRELKPEPKGKENPFL